jgi:signal peptidase I
MKREARKRVAQELQLELSSKSRTLYFHGESMRPFLGEGDEMVVEPVEWRDIRIGDIVTYRFQEKFPTRRVVWKTRRGLHLWCENWPNRRFYAHRRDLLGRAVARRRDGEWITHRDPEWKRARRGALASHRRRVVWPFVVGLARRAVARAARLVGLRRSGASGR